MWSVGHAVKLRLMIGRCDGWDRCEARAVILHGPPIPDLSMTSAHAGLPGIPAPGSVVFSLPGGKSSLQLPLPSRIETKLIA